MSEFNVDTTKLRECGQDIINISNGINEQLNGLFSRISNMTVSTFEWVGSSANNFVNNAKIDRAQYFNYNDELKELGKFLVNQADYIENDIEKIRRL